MEERGRGGRQSGKGACIDDVRTEEGEGIKKHSKFAAKQLRTERGKVSNNHKILWTSYMEAPKSGCRAGAGGVAAQDKP